MLTARYAVVASLPMTVNGKVDRKALAVMGLAQPAVASVAAPARSKLEASLAAIFAEALGLETVGLRDDFFKLAGHSLLAIQVLGRVRERSQSDPFLRSSFEAPPFRQLRARSGP